MKFKGIAVVALGASLLSVAGAKATTDTTSMPVIVRAASSLSAAEKTVAAAPLKPARNT